MQNIRPIKLPEDVTSCNEPKQKARVVVIGAGLAGLAVTQRLLKFGINDVILLEAMDRIGGRVHTVQRSDFLLEMGAQWLHGADQNPLYKWLTELNLLNDFEDASSGFNGLFCTSQGEEIDKSLVLKVLQIVCDSKSSLFKNNYQDMVTNKGYKNAADIFRHHLELQIGKDKQLSENRSLVRSLFEWFLRYEQIENGCDSMSDVSVASYTDWTDWGEGSLLNFKDGYNTLLDWFVGQMPPEQVVYLNKQVLNVHLLHPADSNTWKDSEGNTHTSPVLIKYCDTNTTDSAKQKHRTISCDHVVVTVSLGFLKKNQETFFTPALPKMKQELIRSIGFGTVNKIILQFDRPFWRDSRGFKLIWDTEEPQPNEFPSWVRDIISFDVVRRQPNHLIGWIGGHGARQVELESDEHVGAICLKLMKKFQPKWQLTRLVSCTCSRWNSNPFICGSYSFPSMKSYDLKVEKLQEPLCDVELMEDKSSDREGRPSLGSNGRMPRIMFAGEATAGNLYSTTHGAIISGWREADRLGDLLLAGRNEANTQAGRRSLTTNLVPLDTLIASSPSSGPAANN